MVASFQALFDSRLIISPNFEEENKTQNGCNANGGG